MASLLGVVNAFDVPARQAFVVEMVGKEDLVNAIALNSSIFNAARVLGPSAAGFLIAWIGEGWCFFVNGVSYLAVIAALLLMRTRRVRRARRGSTLEGIAEGFRFVAGTGPVRALLLLVGLVSVMGMPYAVLMPVFADQVLGAGARGYGILLGCSGVGALAGALALAARRGVRGLGRWVAMASAGFGASLAVFSLSRSFLLSALILFPIGFCVIVQMAASNTLLQSMSPDALRGRVMSVFSMMFLGMAPFGGLLAGFLAGRIGAPATLAAGGAACLAGAGLFSLRLPALRAEARRLILAQPLAGGDPPDEVIGEVPVEEADGRRGGR